MSKTNTNTKSLLLRNSLIAISVMGLVASFFVLNYFVLIPKQKEAFNKNVFGIMHQAARDFSLRINGYAEYYGKSNNSTSYKDALRWNSSFKDSNKFVRVLKQSFKGSHDAFDQNENADSVTITFENNSVRFAPKDQTQTKPNKKPGTTKNESKSLSGIIEPLLATENTFDYVVLIKKRGDNAKDKDTPDALLYKSAKLDIDSELDSSFKSNTFPTVRDISVQGISYKLFLLPFQIDRNSLVLEGLIQDRKYNVEIGGYSTIILIGSLLIIIIISLPVLKIFLLNRQERITIADIRLLMASFLIGPVLIILGVCTIWIYSLTDHKTDKSLVELNKKVKENFYNELSQSVKQLNYYNGLIDHPTLNNAYDSFLHIKKIDSLNAAIKKAAQPNGYTTNITFKDLFFYPTIYKNLETVAWTDTGGNMLAKWNFLDRPPSYINLKQRQYFQDIRDNNFIILDSAIDPSFKYPFPDTFSIQPTISWATGEYTINIATKSRLKFAPNKTKGDSLNAIMIILSCNMYSVCNPVLPRGFNFSIIDNTGMCLFHSQTNKSLRENLFEACNDNDAVLNAIHNKDSVLLPAITLDNQETKMLITPMYGLPYYLVTYYDKRGQDLTVFHISAFTFFCAGILLILIFIFLIAYYLTTNKIAYSFFAAHETDWMSPSPSKKGYYQKLILFQLIAGVLCAIGAGISLLGNQLSWFLLECAMVLPFFIITGYYIIKINDEKEKVSLFYLDCKRKKITLYILYGFFMFCFSVCRVGPFLDSNSASNTIGADACIVIMIFIIPLISNKIEKIKSHFKIGKKLVAKILGNDLQCYASAIFLAVIFLSVIPTTCFFYYASNQEKMMQLKSRQIYTAQLIENRATEINKRIRQTKMGISPDFFQHDDSTFKNNLKYSSGNYGIYLQRSMLANTNYNTNEAFEYENKDTADEHFYHRLTQFLFLPPDHLDFFKNNPDYYWKKVSKDSLCLNYKSIAEKANDKSIAITTKVQSESLKTLFTLFTNLIGVFLLISVALILLLHYGIIIPLSKRIFLIGYFKENQGEEGDRKQGTNENKNWMDSIFASVVLTEEDKKLFHDKNFFCDNKMTYKNNIDFEDAQVNERDAGEHILCMQYLLSDCYDKIWNTCNDDEKFILYDFALDGFTNYRNVDILYKLFRKGFLRFNNNGNGRLMLMNYSFRNYLATKGNTEEIQRLAEKMNRGGSWKSIKNIFSILLLGIIIFMFITQQEIVNKLLLIIPGIVTLLPQMLKLFDKSFLTGKADEDSSNSSKK